MRYLNVGNPPAFGFQPPAHLIEAVMRAMRMGTMATALHRAWASPGRRSPQEYTARGWRISPDRVFLTSGTSEGIELALSALVDPDGDVLVPMPTYPLYTAVLGKLGGTRRLLPSRSVTRLAPRHRAAVEPRDPGDSSDRRHRPEQSDRCHVSAGGPAAADRVCGTTRARDPGRRSVRRPRVRRAGAATRQPQSRRGHHFLFEPLQGLSRARLANRMARGSAARRVWTRP